MFEKFVCCTCPRLPPLQEALLQLLLSWGKEDSGDPQLLLSPDRHKEQAAEGLQHSGTGTSLLSQAQANLVGWRRRWCRWCRWCRGACLLLLPLLPLRCAACWPCALWRTHLAAINVAACFASTRCRHGTVPFSLPIGGGGSVGSAMCLALGSLATAAAAAASPASQTVQPTSSSPVWPERMRSFAGGSPASGALQDRWGSVFGGTARCSMQ